MLLRDNMVQCDICNNLFKNKQSLSAHKSKFHKIKKDLDKDIDRRSSSSQDSDESTKSIKPRKRSASRDTMDEPNHKRTKMELESASVPNSDHDSDSSSYTSEDEQVSKLNYDKCSENIKLLKVLCKSVLNGTIKLEDHHIQRLRPMKRTITKFADENLQNTRKLVEKEIKRDKTYGKSDLYDVLSTVIPIVNQFFK